MGAPIGQLLTRRCAFQVRRDAAETMSNGRRRYFALFSRTGIQRYGASVEYRPPNEVFAPESLRSGSNCPGVLLHPAENFGTNFGEGAYPISGVTGDKIVVHTDGVHTAGYLTVWDQGWNDAIESMEVADLSVGYSIFADDTPGVAPDGTEYNTVHRRIIWDHVAGVPEGNAGTARVILDAAQISKVTLASRRALAEIAAARMDARPVYHDLGAWARRRDTEGQPDMTTNALRSARDIHDAMVKLWGDSSDPKMKAAIAAMAAEAGEAPPAAPAEDYEDEDPEGEGEGSGAEQPPAGATPPAEPGQGAEQPPAGEQPPAEGDPASEQPPAGKMDAAKRRHDSAHRRALILVAGMDADPKFCDRVDSTASDTELMTAVIMAADPTRMDKVSRMDAAKRPAAIEVHYDQVRDALAARRDYGQKVIDAVLSMRSDGAANQTEEIRGPLTLMSEQTKAKPRT